MCGTLPWIVGSRALPLLMMLRGWEWSPLLSMSSTASELATGCVLEGSPTRPILLVLQDVGPPSPERLAPASPLLFPFRSIRSAKLSENTVIVGVVSR